MIYPLAKNAVDSGRVILPDQIFPIEVFFVSFDLVVVEGWIVDDGGGGVMACSGEAGGGGDGAGDAFSKSLSSGGIYSGVLGSSNSSSSSGSDFVSIFGAMCLIG